MITYNELQIYIKRWASQVDTASTIYWEQDGGPKETAPAISLRIMTMQDIGQPFYGYYIDPITGDSAIYSVQELTLRLQAYGANSMMRLKRFGMSGLLYEYADYLRENTGMSLLRKEGPYTINTGLNDQRNEERALITLFFSLGIKIEPGDAPPVGIIENVNIEGTLKNGIPATKIIDIGITTP